MKKTLTTNAKLVIVALVTLFAVMISSILVASTSAKYTTSGTYTENATIAAWGVTIEPKTKADGFVFKKDYTEANQGVVSANIVVAPGTSGEITASQMAELFTVSGTPEVAVKICATYRVTYGSSWKDKTDNGEKYRPIKFSLAGEDLVLSNKEGNNTDKLVYEKTFDVVKKIAPGQNVSSNIAAGCRKFSWAWALEGNDEVDTSLAGDGNAAIALQIILTVEQIANAA